MWLLPNGDVIFFDYQKGTQQVLEDKVREQLEHLVALQSVDSELQKLERERGDLPQIVKALKADISQISAALKERGKKREDCETNTRQSEGNLQLLKERLAKYQKQLYSVVSTNKEYDAMTVEIEATEKQIDEAEFTLLELEERIENLTKEIEELNVDLESRNEKLARRAKELDEKLTKTKQAENTLNKKRSELVGQISTPILSRYERVRNAKDGLAVIPVRNNVCSGCFTTIPPQKGLEIRRMDHIILCETCGRILVWENDK